MLEIRQCKITTPSLFSRPLKRELSGCRSRRIDQKHHPVYQVEEDKIRILACRCHYHTANASACAGCGPSGGKEDVTKHGMKR
ncbi:MAG: type II toxin-antitoxin system YoeB family toxin [Desulfobacterales bacterium]|nr:MAG: type II toxin-antitoxin system YoeB family toxin [Desulfobacterales bacterium]